MRIIVLVTFCVIVGCVMGADFNLRRVHKHNGVESDWYIDRIIGTDIIDDFIDPHYLAGETVVIIWKREAHGTCPACNEVWSHSIFDSTTFHIDELSSEPYVWAVPKLGDPAPVSCPESTIGALCTLFGIPTDFQSVLMYAVNRLLITNLHLWISEIDSRAFNNKPSPLLHAPAHECHH